MTATRRRALLGSISTAPSVADLASRSGSEPVGGHYEPLPRVACTPAGTRGGRLNRANFPFLRTAGGIHTKFAATDLCFMGQPTVYKMGAPVGVTEAIRSPAVAGTKEHFMRFVLLMLAVILTAGAARAQNLVPPEIVRLENVQGEGETKINDVGNAKKHYFLHCNTKAAGCITPEENKNYLLFNKYTHWKLPARRRL